jgi:stress-induced-phosphoprotein 1
LPIKIIIKTDLSASEKFTEAIALDPANHVLYSNRSGSYASLKDFDKALADANKVIEIKPDWVKGYTRKAAAMHGQGDLGMHARSVLCPSTAPFLICFALVGAHDAYDDALKLEPANAQAKKGLESLNRAIQSESGAENPMRSFSNMFADPQLISKLASNPKTSSLLADPEFMMKLQRIRQDPDSLDSNLLQDPRFLQVFGVLMGLDMTFGGPGSEAEATARAGTYADPPEDELMPDAKPAAGSSSRRSAPQPEPEVEEEDEEEKAKREAKAKADEEKKLGTENYKKKQFDAAIAHYSKAWELHKDITYLTNLGAAYFEKGDYEKCIEACRKAVDEGREVLADFKLIAKAFSRIGTAYEKLGDLANAIKSYQSSLTEHRTPDILTKLRNAEKAKIIADKNAYVDPDKAAEARELGNSKFKEADWPAAVEAYSEMIKRAPDDPRGYANRAACFIKLLGFPSAVQDCDEAIKRDPKYIRAYLRKAQAYFAMREYNRCVDVCTEAIEHDEDGKSAREIEQQQQKAMQAMFSARDGETEEQTMERVQRDPDVSPFSFCLFFLWPCPATH